MSSGVNRVFLIGNLGADPEVRTTARGTPVCNFRVATTRKWKGDDGALQEDTQWHRIVTWDKLATICHRYLSRGSKVYVEGRLQTDKWVDREGQSRWSTQVVAQQVVFLGARPQLEDEAPAPRSAAGF